MSMRTLFFLTFSFSISINILQAQSYTNERFAFVNHLVTLDELDEAQIVLGQYSIPSLSPVQRDSLYYLQGWIAYRQKNLMESVSYWQQVSSDSQMYPKARFFMAYNLAYSDFPDSSKFVLDTSVFQDSIHLELRDFEQAGIALLQRDLTAFRTHQTHFTKSYYSFSKEEEAMEGYALSIEKYIPQKPMVAAVMSALVPGTGKMYAGKPGEGVFALLFVGALAGVTLENWIKAGPANPKTIAFGSLGTLFYLGNIYGSYYSVKRSNYEFNEQINQRILYDLHIPLRTLFE